MSDECCEGRLVGVVDPIVTELKLGELTRCITFRGLSLEISGLPLERKVES